MYNQFQNLFKSLQKEWTNSEDRTELLAILWLFQSTLQEYIEEGKQELREKGGTHKTPFGTFTVSDPKTDYVLKENDHLDQRLGHYFQLLFQTKTTIHPKFEEVYTQLPSEMKEVVFKSLEQKTRKARVSFKKRGAK